MGNDLDIDLFGYEEFKDDYARPEEEMTPQQSEQYAEQYAKEEIATAMFDLAFGDQNGNQSDFLVFPHWCNLAKQ